MSAKAIIPAAGSGKRIGSDIPKQYISLAGLPVLIHTLIKFQRSELIDEIILVVGKGEVKWVKDCILADQDLKKVSSVVEGGVQRQDSVACGLKQVWDNIDDNDIVVIHDAVRPFVDQKKIDDCIWEAKKTGACVLGIQIKETLKTIDEGGIILTTVPYQGVWIAQTPQAFRASLLKKAYINSKDEGFYGTDEASLVERLPYPIKVIPGSYWNIKITYPEDLELAEQILQMRALI